MSFASRFLTDPTSVRALSAGQPWGDSALCLDLPGGPYSVECLSPLQATAAKERLAPLCVPAESNPNVRVQVLRTNPEQFRAAVEFDRKEYTFDIDRRAKSIRVAGLGFFGHFELDHAKPARLCLSDPDRLVGNGVLENFLRVVLAYRLLQAGGLLLHSAAVVKDGRAYIFIGRSGAGKSTISRMGLTAGLDVLSDDMNALVPEGGRYWAEKLPFAGDLGQTAKPKGRYPVAGIYRLGQGAHNAIERLSSARAMAALLACAPFVNADPHRSERLAANIERLLGSVPVSELMFNLDGGVWELL
jgi:hypothetical protein